MWISCSAHRTTVRTVSIRAKTKIKRPRSSRALACIGRRNLIAAPVAAGTPGRVGWVTQKRRDTAHRLQSRIPLRTRRVDTRDKQATRLTTMHMHLVIKLQLIKLYSNSPRRMYASVQRKVGSCKPPHRYRVLSERQGAHHSCPPWRLLIGDPLSNAYRR